eukprot:s57_g9.t1
MERPIDLLCEEERLRRLSERMSLDEGDAAEPARQRRARILLQEMTNLGPRLRSKSSEDRRSKAIRALEAGLQARWKAVVHEMSEAGSRRSGRQLAETKLLDALETVTVRSVVGLRGLTEVPKEVESVALAVLTLVSSEYLGLGPDSETPKTWEEARRVLLKPGHFVSSLRKFPFAVEQGQVSASNISVAHELMKEVGPQKSSGLAKVHDGAGQLYSWLVAALDLTSALGFSIAAAASPARACAPCPAPPEAYPKSEPGSPVHEEKAKKAIPAASKEPKVAVRSFSPRVADREKPATPSGHVKGVSTSTSNGYSKPTTTAAALPSGSRNAGFNLSWSNLSGAPKPVLPQRSGRISAAGVSPKRRSSPSPTPKPVAPKVTARPRNSLNGTSSPQPSRPAAKSPGPFTRSRSAGRDAKNQEVVPTGKNNPLSFASISSAAMPLSKDFAGIRIGLDKEKKEVRQMRGIESQLKWDMYREERSQTEEERREEARQIMAWRDREAKEMREYVEGKSRDQRALELMESKEYQEFKRAWKQAMRKEEIERIKVQLAENMDNAQWRVDLQKAVEMDRQLALQENMEAQQELRELKEKDRQREKVMQDEERARDLALEYAHQAHQISTEKEALLRSLALLRERQKASVVGTPTRVGTTFWPIAR